MNHAGIKFTLATIVLSSLLAGCWDVGSSALFNSTSADSLHVQARISEESATVVSPQRIDTLVPGDSVILQGEILPSRGVKTMDHWWIIDDDSLRSDFAFKWSFGTPGLHHAVFYVIDRFGDTLQDTAFARISNPPVLAGLFIPRDSAWALPYQMSTGVTLQWEISPTDSGSVLSHHVYLYRKPCGDHNKDSLLIDTIVAENQFHMWENLEPLCRYAWNVSVANQYGQKTSTIADHTFFTASADGSAGLDIPVERAGICGNLDRFGDSTVFRCAGVNHRLHFQDLAAGVYQLIVWDSLHSEYIRDTLLYSLASSQLAVSGLVRLTDSQAPQLKCSICLSDTIPPNSWPISFVVSEQGSGWRTDSTFVYLDGNVLPWSSQGDTLRIPVPKWTLAISYHMMQVMLQDSVGNTTTQSYWLEPAQ